MLAVPIQWDRGAIVSIGLNMSLEMNTGADFTEARFTDDNKKHLNI